MQVSLNKLPPATQAYRGERFQCRPGWIIIVNGVGVYADKLPRWARSNVRSQLDSRSLKGEYVGEWTFGTEI